MHNRTVEKVSVMGSNYLDELINHIPLTNIPAAIGISQLLNEMTTLSQYCLSICIYLNILCKVVSILANMEFLLSLMRDLAACCGWIDRGQDM